MAYQGPKTITLCSQEIVLEELIQKMVSTAIKKSILNVKYEKECRMDLGCAMVTPLDADNQPLPSEGRRCSLFDYTSKVLVSISN